MGRITCSADELINPTRADHAHLEYEKVLDIASNLYGIPFVRFQISGGPRSLFGKSLISAPVYLSIEAAQKLREDLDIFIKECVEEQHSNFEDDFADSEPAQTEKLNSNNDSIGMQIFKKPTQKIQNEK